VHISTVWESECSFLTILSNSKVFPGNLGNRFWSSFQTASVLASSDLENAWLLKEERDADGSRIVFSADTTGKVCTNGRFLVQVKVYLKTPLLTEVKLLKSFICGFTKYL
jgi:hypothetical protein